MYVYKCIFKYIYIYDLHLIRIIDIIILLKVYFKMYKSIYF